MSFFRLGGIRCAFLLRRAHYLLDDLFLDLSIMHLEPAPGGGGGQEHDGDLTSQGFKGGDDHFRLHIRNAITATQISTGTLHSAMSTPEMSSPAEALTATALFIAPTGSLAT